MDSARMWADSLAKQEVTSQMAEVKVKYETQEKELEITRLREKVLKQEADSLKIALALIAGLACLVIILLQQRHKRRNAERELLRMRQEKELESARSYIEGLEEECRHFAKELHDGTANDLLALEMKARTEKQASMAEAIKQVRENVRSISHELMPPEFESLSLNEILSQYARSLTENTGVRVSYNESSSSPTPPDALPQRTAREVYRIVQEITMNVIKHTDASSIGIRLSRHTDGNILLQITDNGHPIYPNRPQTEEKGIGLRTISDRAKAIRATIENQTDEKENRFIMTFKIESNEREFV